MEETKKLYRSIENRYIGGVCSGLAEYFDIDVVIVRLLFFIALIIGGGGFFAYIILWIVIPEEPIKQKHMNMNENDTKGEFAETSDNNEQKAEKSQDQQSKKRHNRNNMLGGIILVTIGILFLLDNLTSIEFGNLWPVLLIVAGIAVLINSFNNKNKKNNEF